MLQRAASNAYSWWRASHVRSKQSKWLDSNLEEMEDTVKKMLKVIEPDADSFGKRAELYFKRRPELISFVEDAYRSYRALAERYDHISGELHKANHTISTCLPDRVQYAMLEDEDSIPRALTPINPSKINKETVEGLMNKKREKKSSKKAKKKKHAAPRIDVETAREEINKLQKAILVLQTEKEFVKSSYESGIAKHWEIEKRIMEMQEEVCRLQDEFNTSAVIEDDEARSLMTAAVLKSCEDTIVNLQEQRKKSLEQAKKESERTKIAKEKMKALKCENFETGMEISDLSKGNMSLSPENIEEEFSSLHKARTELQSLSEKIKEHFEKNPESSVLEIAEKIEEFANKVITMELTVSSHTLQINQLSSENDELEKYVKSMEEEKSLLADGSNELSEKLKEVVEELRRVEAVESVAQNEEINFRKNLSETWDSLNGISELLNPQKSLEYACIGDASQEDDVSLFDSEIQEDCEGKKATEIHEIKEDSVYAIHTTQELGHLGDPSLTDSSARAESGKELTTADPSIHVISNEEIALDEKEDDDVTFFESETQEDCEGKKATEIHQIKEDSMYTIHTTQELGHLGDPSLIDSIASAESGKELPTADPSIHVTSNEEIALDGKEDYLKLQQLQGEEMILLTEYRSLLQNYEDTKRKLSEVEKKNEEYLQQVAALIEDLKNDIAMKDEEIRLLRQPVASERESCTDSVTPDALTSEYTLTSEECSLDPQKPVSTSNSSTAKKNFSRQGPRRTKHLIVEKAHAKRNSSVDSTKIQSSLAKDSGVQSINDAGISSPIGKKFRKEIDALLDERLEFWLRFSTSFHNIQAYKDKYEDLQTEITRLKDDSQECDGNVNSDQFGRPESTKITSGLRQLKTELQVWLEQGALLSEDLQNRFSSLCDMQEEINSALSMTSESGSPLFTPCQAARFQGEVMNMKQENNKVVRELQAGLDQVKGLQSEIERELSILTGNVGPLVPKGSSYDCMEYAPNRTNVPLRDFLFGVKPKKPSVLSLIQQSKLKCVRRKID